MKNANLPYEILRCDTREEWLEARKAGIGSSEAGTIAGVNTFDTPLKLWQRKRGVIAPEKESKVMSAGHLFESAVALLFSQETGAIIDTESEGDWIAVDKKKPHLRVSPDRLFYAPDTPEPARIWENALLLECKTTSKPVSADNIPDYWFYQVMYQLRVLGMKYGYVAWISTWGGLNFGFTRIDYDEDFMAALEAKLDDFWKENIVGGKMPDDVMDSEDAAIRWKQASVDENGKPTFVTADDKILNLVAEYGEIYPQYKEMEDRMSAIKLGVQCYMGEASRLVGPENQVLASWNNTTCAAKFNTKRFAEENPELYKQYLGEASIVRRFVFK